MAFKFPFTNYHELNLTWVLDQLKSLFEKSEENVTVIENYNGRLTAVETELPLVEETAQGAAQQAAGAATLAQQAKSTADTAQENAIQAQGLAGTARQEAQAAQAAADAATQAAQQAQATAQNFDGRITQAENDASQALEASQSFENRVQSAITTANNAAQTATNAQGIATRADQNAALALDTLKAQRSELERIGAEQVERITEETESGKTEIENLAQSVLDSIPSDYTALSNLVDKKAPVIINSASGAVASFNDGADNMKIQKLAVNIEPVQAGSGDPSPDNVRPISGWTGAKIEQTGVNVWDEEMEIGMINDVGTNGIDAYRLRTKNYIKVSPGSSYYASLPGSNVLFPFYYDKFKNFVSAGTTLSGVFTIPNNCEFMRFHLQRSYGTTYNHNISINYPATDTTYHPYTGNQISVTFPETIYGGEDEVISGKLKSTMGIVDLGTLDWTRYSTSNVFYTYGVATLLKPPASNYVLGNYISSQLKQITTSTPFNENNVFNVSDGGAIWCKIDDTYTDPALFKAALSGVQFCYELKNPVEYTLTPQEVKTLYGANNIWADAGPVSVDYPADTKLYIDGKLAELQATILENI